jgi:hypothetical protein
MFQTKFNKEEAAWPSSGRSSGSGRVILPQPVLEMLDCGSDTELELHVEGQRLILSAVGPSDQTTEEPKKRRPPKS